jgi:hypothetical protein
MGTESKRTTECHYGSMSDVTVLESIGIKKMIDPRNLLVSEKAEILDGIHQGDG